MNPKTKECFKEETFSIKKFIDSDLHSVIKLENLSSNNEYLENIKDIIEQKKNELSKDGQKFSQKDSQEMILARDNQTYKALKIITEEFENIREKLVITNSLISDELKGTKMVKRKIDKIMKEKEKINSEIFVLDLIKNMKINENNQEKISSISEKIKFAKNVKEIENLVHMYEKNLIPKLRELITQVETEFLKIITIEIQVKKFEYTFEILEYFRISENESTLFEVFCQNFILKINFSTLTSAFNSENVQNLALMFENYFNVVDIFFDKAINKETHFIKFMDEMLFNKFTGYFFERYLTNFLDVILLKNLRNNNQFYLEYLEQVSTLLQNLSQKFENIGKYSLLLQELLFVYKYGCLAKYYEEYFIIEEKYFVYCNGIYINLLRDKINSIFCSKKQNIGDLLFEILSSEKLEEYLNFMGKSMKRVTLLSDESYLANNMVKLLKISLSEFKTFMEFIVENLDQNIQNSEKEFTNFSIFKLNNLIYLLINRVYAMQTEFSSMIQSSIFFIEIDNLKRSVFESVKSKLLKFNSKSVKNIFKVVSYLVINSVDKKSTQEGSSIIEKTYSYCYKFIQEIELLQNPEFKKASQIIFYKEFILLIDDLFLKTDKNAKAKINFTSEFKFFFEIFNKIKIKNLEGDIFALQYLMLSLKSNEKDIWKLVDPQTRELVNLEKMENYNSFLNKRK